MKEEYYFLGDKMSTRAHIVIVENGEGKSLNEMLDDRNKGTQPC